MHQVNESLEAQVEQRTRQVRKLAYELTMAEQHERRRLSQILHDSLQQRLYGIQMKMTFVRDHAQAGDVEKLEEYADQAWEWIDQAIETTRRLSVDLSPPILSSDGLTDALNWLQGQMSEMYDFQVDLKADDPIPIDDRDMLVLLFHLVRELLFNVVKHAETDHATLKLTEEDGQVFIRVIDGGVGFDLDGLSDESESGGFGLFSVRERLNLFGGHLDIATAPGEGTTMTIRVPIDAGPGKVTGEVDPKLDHKIRQADEPIS
jgi:signal transduction histidine kinase